MDTNDLKGEKNSLERNLAMSIQKAIREFQSKTNVGIKSVVVDVKKMSAPTMQDGAMTLIFVHCEVDL